MAAIGRATQNKTTNYYLIEIAIISTRSSTSCDARMSQTESSQSPFGRRSALRCSRTLYRRSREYPDYLAMELVDDDELQLPMEDLCWVYDQAAAHRTARVCREAHRGWFALHRR